MGGLPLAPGGPDKIHLASIDARSPIAGLYVRLERLFAKQVHKPASAVATVITNRFSVGVGGAHRELR